MQNRPGRPVAPGGRAPMRPISGGQSGPRGNGGGGGHRRQFEYIRRTPEMVRQVRQASASRWDSPFLLPMVRWKDGVNICRILPPTFANANHYAMEVFEHRRVGADNGNYICLKMRDERCPICEAAAEAKRRGDQEANKNFYARQRWVMWVLNRKDEQDQFKPKIWDIWTKWNNEILDVGQDLKTGAIIYPEDPDVGYDLMFRRTNTGGDRMAEYGGWQFDRDPSPISSDPDQQYLVQEFINDNPLDQQLKFHDYDYLQRVLYGTAEAPDEDLDTTSESAVGDEENEQAPWGEQQAEQGEEQQGEEQFVLTEAQDEGADPDVAAAPPARQTPRQVSRQQAPQGRPSLSGQRPRPGAQSARSRFND